MHMPLHRQVRGDDPLRSIHRQLQQFVTGGSPNLEGPDVKHKVCRKTHSQDNPSDKLGTRPLDILHQMAYYERRVVNPLLEVLFAPKPLEKQAHPLCLPGRVHEPENTNSYNSSAQAG